MSNIEIRKVTTSKDMNVFAEFGNKLYKDSDYAVPDLIMDLKDTFNPKKNAAYDFCEAELFLAYKEGKCVGRVAAMINNRANETWDVKCVRFGYLDFEDDKAISEALLAAVEEWGRAKGMNLCQGPLGFTDFDKEGMLVDGFDQMGSITTYYNYPYYPEHMDVYGYEKATDWIQMRVKIPEAIPERFVRGAELAMKRFGMKIGKLNRDKVFRQGYGQRIFDLLNEAYAPLFGFSKLSQRQVDSFVKTYFQLVDLNLVTIIEDKDGQLVGVGVTMASLSEAMRKAKGKLLPFGWWHLLNGLKFKHSKTVEMLLIAVKPEYQAKGINALLFVDLIPIYLRYGFEFAETAPHLETNHKMLNQWDVFNPDIVKRRRCYKKEL